MGGAPPYRAKPFGVAVKINNNQRSQSLTCFSFTDGIRNNFLWFEGGGGGGDLNISPNIAIPPINDSSCPQSGKRHIQVI